LQGVLFDESNYVVKSKHYNLIAFSVDISMLLKVLSSAGVNDADVLEVKLTQKAIQIPGKEERENKPFLSFQAKVGGCPKASSSLLNIYKVQ
jgi:HUS1 checkpoint protein